MRFVLVDRITDIQPGRSLTAVKNLSLTEEYLADHFPGFPVMPGVLMLEALTQSGAWLLRDLEDFAFSVIVLKSAKTIKYGSFLEPGRRLTLHVELTDLGPREATFRGEGRVEDQIIVRGRFTLTRWNLREKNPELHSTDRLVVEHMRDLYATLRKGTIAISAVPQSATVTALAAPPATA